jgi:uncharacterized protein
MTKNARIPQRSQGIHVIAKPSGPACNLNCEYCFYLEKQMLLGPGEKYHMSDGVVSAFISRTERSIDA